MEMTEMAETKMTTEQIDEVLNKARHMINNPSEFDDAD